MQNETRLDRVLQRLGVLAAPPSDRVAAALETIPTAMKILAKFPRAKREVVAVVTARVETDKPFENISGEKAEFTVQFNVAKLAADVLKKRQHAKAWAAVQAAVRIPRQDPEARTPTHFHMVREQPESGEILK